MHPIYSFNKYSSFQFPYMRRSIQRQGLAHNEGKLSLYVSNFTFNTLLHCYCIKTKQDCCDRRKSDTVLQFDRTGSKILYAVDHVFHLLCAFNYVSSANEKILIFRCVPEPLVRYKLRRVALGTRMNLSRVARFPSKLRHGRVKRYFRCKLKTEGWYILVIIYRYAVNCE